jgi:aryl-alcohol dehydrogenase-like predicted oxidoreductase
MLYKIGYRHIDAALAYKYGSVERDIGAAICQSGIALEHIFVVTKLTDSPHNLPCKVRKPVCTIDTTDFMRQKMWLWVLNEFAELGSRLR